MRYIRRSLKFNRIVYRKYTKKYKFNIKILTFLKSNYKYKRRCLRKTLTDKMSVERNSSHRRQIRNNNEMQKEKHQLPVEEDMLKNNKNIIQRIPIYDNTKLDKFLKIFILIMQQAQLTATAINDDTRKNASNGLATRLVAKTKAIKNINRLSSTSNVNEDEMNRNHRAYKDANKDTDNNIDIGSNIVDEISHQQHNYDKVSTITSIPIKCQRRKHLQLNATKTSATTTLSPSSSSPSAPLASPTTMTTSLSSPSVVVQTNYETYQWSAILRNCACDSPPIHHQYQYHHYHHKRKHIQHHHFYQQHQQQQYQWQQHAVHIKSLTSRSLLSDNNNNNNNSNNNNKSDSSSIKNNNRSHNSNTIDSPTCSAIAVYQTFDQYVNATWNRSYSISCLLLTLFIAFTIGIRSTTAGACWQTVLDNGKCNEIFSLNISKSECCGANQEFAYTEREPTNVEYFFATAIGGGMECSPCLESCRNVKCGPNKKCVKRKGRPKCICAPECGAARRRRKQREHSVEQEQRGHQHHTADLFTSIPKDVGDVDNEDDDMSSATVVQSSNGFNIKIDKSQQSRDIRSLSSEITNVNLGLKDGKHVMMINSGGATSQMERHHSNNKEHKQNQRKLIHVHLEEHPYSQQQQQQQRQQKSKKSIDLQQYTHQMQHQQHQQEDQLRLQLEQQQTKRKDQEPKGSRRLLITANVEHTEKPTTRRLQIFSNVRTTHARRRNSNKNKTNTSNSNRNRNNNRKKNKKDQHEDTDPSDTDIDDKVVENDEDYNYNDTEDNEDNIETKLKYRSSNGNSNSNNKNNINRNDDATRFLNQSLSRHKLTTNIRVNNKNSNSSSSSHSNSKSKSSDNNSKSNERKIKRRKNHDLQGTEILQHHSSDNNTRIRYPQQNQSHAVDISHHRHNRHHHRQQKQRKHNHHRQDFHNPNHHKKHHQQQNHHRRHHGRQKFNTHQQQQTAGTKDPKNDKDYNATITVVSPIPITITPAAYNTSDTTKIAPFTTVLQSQVLNAALATPLVNLSSPSSSSSSSSSSSALENSTSVIIVTTTPNQQIQPSRSQLLLSSSAMSSLSAATPVNSTLSALNSGAAAAVDAADDFYHSHSQNHGSKIATSSSSQSPSTTSSSYSQPSVSVSVSASSESAFLPSVSAKGEGVSRHDHQHRRIQILTSNKHNNNNNDNDNDNDDHKIGELNSNLHNNPQQQEEQKEQQHDQQPQAHQQYFHSTLFDAISDQIDFMGFSTKQQTITDAEFDRPLNPVCGTDGRTYNTECQLRKRACRTDNPNLQIAYRGHCRTTCNGVKCLNGLTCIEDQYSMPHCITCKIECPQDDCDNDVVDATKAVCGADGKTYKSVCDINRMICKIGRSIGVAYPGPCRVEQITCDDINCGPKQVCLIDWLTHTPRCTSCRYKCSRKRRPSFPPFEEGKICGVNNRTYNSWCEMRKDSCSTGFYIDLKYSGDCR